MRRVDDGKWGLIAGWVEPNETPEQTVVRELAEEVGLVARVDRLVGVFFRAARADEHPHSVVSVVYLCSIIGGDAARRSPTRCTRSRGATSTTSRPTTGTTTTRRSRAPRATRTGGRVGV